MTESELKKEFDLVFDFDDCYSLSCESCDCCECRWYLDEFEEFKRERE